MQRMGGGGPIQAGDCEATMPETCPFYARGGSKKQSGGTCGCMSGKVWSGGYKATKKDRMYLRRWKQGKSIGFTMKASLKAKGLIPRTSKSMKGKKVVSKKYKNKTRKQVRKN